MRRLVVLAVVVAGLAVSRPAVASTTGDVSARETPPLSDLVLGSDGALWGTGRARVVVRFVPGHADSLATFPTPRNVGSPSRIVASPTGDLWVRTGTGQLLRVDVDTHAITRVQGVGVGQDLAFGPDGRIWTTGPNWTRARAIDVSDDEVVDGEITDVQLSGDAAPTGLASGQDGNLWLVDEGLHRLIRIDPSTETTTSFRLPGDVNDFTKVFVDDAGVVWIARRSSIASIDPATRSFHAFPTPVLATMYGQALVLPVEDPVVGPDGQLWLIGEGALSRLDRETGDYDVYPLRPVTAFSASLSLATDRRGQLWAAYGRTLLRVEDRPSSDTVDPTVAVARPANGAHYLESSTVRVRLHCRAPGGGVVVDCLGKWLPYLDRGSFLHDGQRIPFNPRSGFLYARHQFNGLVRDQAGNTAFSELTSYYVDHACFGRAARLGAIDFEGTEGDDVLVLTDERDQGGHLRGLGGDDLLCATGRWNEIDGGPGYDRCHGGRFENTYISCEQIVDG